LELRLLRDLLKSLAICVAFLGGGMVKSVGVVERVPVYCNVAIAVKLSTDTTGESMKVQATIVY